MLSSKLAVSILMLLVVPMVLAGVPTANSQSYTTITNYSTLITPYTTTLTGTSTSLTTTISSKSIGPIIAGGSTRIDPTGGSYECINAPFAFQAHRGDVVAGNLTSDISITYFLLSSRDYTTWLSSTDPCGTHTGAIVDVFAVTSSSMTAVMPEDGVYWLVLLNFSSDKPANVKFDPRIVGSQIVVSATTTTQTTVLRTTTSIMSVVQTEQVGFSLGQNTLLVAIIAVVAIVAVGGALAYGFARKRRK